MSYLVGIVMFLAFLSFVAWCWSLPIRRDCTPIRHDWNRSRGQVDTRLEREIPDGYYDHAPRQTREEGVTNDETETAGFVV